MTSCSIGSDSCSPKLSSQRLPILPPCRVCGVKASGLHYGVNSCEACKGFFRRSLTNSKKYVCVLNGDCDIVLNNRNKCPFCRYQKCLKAGMSVHSIRTGRYTHEKRARDVIEVKTLEGKLRNSLSDEERHTLINSLHQGIRNSEMLSVLSTHYTTNSSQNPGDVNNNLSTEFDDHLPHQTCCSKLELTSMSKKDVIERWSIGSNKKIYLVVLLAKSIPGFSTLPLGDQISLLKASRAEAINVVIHNQFVWESWLLHDSFSGHKITKSELINVYGDEVLVEKMFEMAHRFQLLKLTVSELLLIVSIIVTFPDRVDLEDRTSVEKIQNRLVLALKDCVELNHPEEKNLLARILVNLVSLREVTLRSNKALPKIHQDWFSNYQFDPFWEEFISDSKNWYDNHF